MNIYAYIILGFVTIGLLLLADIPGMIRQIKKSK